MANGNPLFNESAFEQTMNRAEAGGVMTLQGTINKTFFLLLLCVIGALISWNRPQVFDGYLTLIAIACFAVAVVIIYKKTTAPMLAPLYAIGEGLLLGVISAVYNAQYQGIVAQAVGITFAVFFVMLFLYRTKIIVPTRRFVIGVVSATGGIALFYIVSMALSLFGVGTSFLNSSSPLSIAISVFICIIAALNFILDFSFIDQLTSNYAAPKYMEWYAGFSLLVTLIWLYLEVLRLLGKTRSR